MEVGLEKDVLGGGVIGGCGGDECGDGEVWEGVLDEGAGEFGGVSLVPMGWEEPVADFDFGIGVV